MLAKNVNNNARFLNKRGAGEFFASKLAPTENYWHSGTGIALSIHHPENRSMRYPPTQSRPHKKVRTRPVGTFSHGLIKTCVFLSGSATQSHTGH